MDTLFKGECFYLSPGPSKAEITELITKHGGTMAGHFDGDGTIHLIDQSSARCIPQTTYPLYSIGYVTDSVELRKVQNLEKYMVTTIGNKYDPKERSVHKPSSYQPEEDLILWEYFNEHGGQNSLTFFSKMQSRGILNRSGESLKTRFKMLRRQPPEYFDTLEKRVAAMKSSASKRRTQRIISYQGSSSTDMDPVGKRRPTFSDPSINATDAIRLLHEQSEQPIEVVLHALLLFSGDISKAAKYLKGGHLDDAWTTGEDQILIGDDDEDDEDMKLALQELGQLRSKHELEARSKFLSSVPDLLQY